MSEISDQLRSYAEWVERYHPPVDPAALRLRADIGSALPDLEPYEDDTRTEGRRGPIVLAAALVVLIVTVGAVVVARQSALPEGPTSPPGLTQGSGSTIPFVPRPLELPPVGNDPTVSCEPARGEWFTRSALDGPKGAENGSDPPAEALKRAIDLTNLANHVAGGALVPTLPTADYRRVSETPNSVTFEAGDYTGPMSLLSFRTVQLIDGEWQATGGGGGTCSALWVQPPNNGSVVGWTMSAADPETSVLHLSVRSLGVPCNQLPSLTAADLYGPDVIETDNTVTINVASRRPPANSSAPCPGLGTHTEPAPTAIDVPLTRPLGNRHVLDATVFPAQAANVGDGSTAGLIHIPVATPTTSPSTPSGATNETPVEGDQTTTPPTTAGVGTTVPVSNGGVDATLVYTQPPCWNSWEVRLPGSLWHLVSPSELSADAAGGPVHGRLTVTGEHTATFIGGSYTVDMTGGANALFPLICLPPPTQG